MSKLKTHSTSMSILAFLPKITILIHNYIGWSRTKVTNPCLTMPRSPRNRAWCFTLNNYVEADLTTLLGATNLKYAVIGREVGENGTPHLQGYIYFDTMKSLTGLKALSERAHWEIAKGTAQQNRVYCSKQGNFVEQGVMPATQEEKGAKGAAAIALRWEHVKKRQWEQLPPEHLQKYEYAEKKLRAKPSQLGSLKNLWIYGESGAGKTKTVRERFLDLYDKDISGWWCGYDNEPAVLIDDLDPSNAPQLADHLKRWADHGPFQAQVKGGMMHIRPERIIVTSQFSIAECFPPTARDPEGRHAVAITRRFKQINLTPGSVLSDDMLLIDAPVVNSDVIDLISDISDDDSVVHVEVPSNSQVY